MSETLTLICPYTSTCILYENWVKKMHDRRVNVIYDGNGYHCMVLDAHDDPTSEGGITFSKDVQERISSVNVKENINMRGVGCSHITLLNSL